MKLTEGQLFTIEALNKVKGFVWPEKAEFASCDAKEDHVAFYSDKPKRHVTTFQGGYMYSILVRVYHPDWRNSLVTKEQFESVDGWVEHNGQSVITSELVDLELSSMAYLRGIRAEEVDWSRKGCGSDVKRWRYHKPEAKVLTPQPTQEAVPNNKTFIPSVGDDFKVLTPKYYNLGSFCCVGITTNKHIIGEAASGLLFTFAPHLPFI